MVSERKSKSKSNSSSTDFLKEKAAEKNDQISSQEILGAASLKNDTTRKVLGFLILVFSVILFISFVSFFFSWKYDQSFLADGDWQLFKENNGHAENSMGYMGAKLGYFFVHNGFGLGAFLLLPYIALSGMYLLFDYRPFSLLRILIHTLLLSVWVSLFLGFVFQWWFPLLGGTFGYFGIQQLQNSMGVIGAVLVLIVFAVVYSFVFHNANPFARLKIKPRSPIIPNNPENDENAEENDQLSGINDSESLEFKHQNASGMREENPFGETDESTLGFEQRKPGYNPADPESPEKGSIHIPKIIEDEERNHQFNASDDIDDELDLEDSDAIEPYDPASLGGITLKRIEDPIENNVASSMEILNNSSQQPDSLEPTNEIAPDVFVFTDEEEDLPVDQNAFHKEIEEALDDVPVFRFSHEDPTANQSAQDSVKVNGESQIPTTHSPISSNNAPVPPAVAPVNTNLGFEVNIPQNEEENTQNSRGNQPSAEYGSIHSEYDPKANLSNYRYPTLDLLTEYGVKKQDVDLDEIGKSKKLIEETLLNYKIGISTIKASVGPTVTLYEIVPAPGVKISKIKNLEDDIALSLAALGIRIIAPIPGKGTIGIEVPNRNPEMVPMRGLLASKKFQECDYQLPVALGKTISNEIFIADLAKMPHLLMAGATGQGKSVGLNAILVSLLYKKHPAYIKFVLVDPKKVELTLYNKIERHFLAKLPGDGDAIITDNQKVIHTLNSLCVEMDDRYKLLQDALVRNIVEYNAKFLDRKLNPQNGHRFMPYIVVVIDEVADLMMTAGKEIEIPIARLAQLARAIGIHLILATQRPSVNVITGMIKANFPARIAFRVTSKIDSRTILDANGADQLIGKGDMLFNGGNEMIRLQCPFVDTPEVEKIVDYIGEQRAYPTAYMLPEVQDDSVSSGGGEIDAADRDPMFEDAARIIVQNQVGSTSMIQRKLKLGYNRAGRLMDQLEDAGIVGPNLGSKPRQVLVPDEYALEQFLNNLNS
jgi:DNA segregation ATPase FtsK/SpoIIIE-like protein